jgi:hypothetical protein
MESLFNNKKGENMTIDQLIQEALKRPENYNADGSVNGCFIDADTSTWTTMVPTQEKNCSRR